MALQQNRQVVCAFAGAGPKGRPLFAFFFKCRQSPSRLSECHHDSNDCGHDWTAYHNLTAIPLTAHNPDSIQANLTRLQLSWHNPRGLCLDLLHCRRIGRLRFHLWREDMQTCKLDSHHHICLDGIAISTIVVAASWGGKILMQLKSICPDSMRISKYPPC